MHGNICKMETANLMPSASPPTSSLSQETIIEIRSVCGDKMTIRTSGEVDFEAICSVFLEQKCYS